MGEAKRRGTYEQRRKEAESREAESKRMRAQIRPKGKSRLGPALISAMISANMMKATPHD